MESHQNANRTMLVVSFQDRWPEYVPLAKRLSKSGSSLVIAAWEDIDTKTRTIKKWSSISPDGAMTQGVKTLILPQAIWFKQTSIGLPGTVAAVKALEAAGCSNVNSSEAISLASDKIASASVLSSVCRQGNPRRYDDNTLQNATADILKPGVKWAKPVSSSLGRQVVRFIGRGKTTIVSRRVMGSPIHKILDGPSLKSFLGSQFRSEEFMVQDDLGSIHIGDKNFELRFIMRRTQSGWKTSSKIARAGELISNPNLSTQNIVACSASQALRMAFHEEWEAKLGMAEQTALDACMAFQSALSTPDAVGELGVDITFLDGKPSVVEVNSVPDLTFVDRAATGDQAIQALAQAIGEDEQVSPVPEAEQEASRGDVADVIDSRINNRRYRMLVERELAHHSIWYQPNGSVALMIQEPSGENTLKVMPFSEALAGLRSAIETAIEDANEVKMEEGVVLRQAIRIARREMHRYAMLCELYYILTGDKPTVKKAYYNYDYNPSGPNQRIQLMNDMYPIVEFPEDQWTEDYKQKLPRYGPIDYDRGDGFYWAWPGDWNGPISWDDYIGEEGAPQGDYPIRTNLKR